MDEAKREDENCLGQAGLIGWLKAKLGISPKAVVKVVKLSPQGEQVIESVRAALEAELGTPLTVIDLGLIQIQKPCKCKICQLRRMAPWN